MLVLLQLLKHFSDKQSKEVILSWCELIQQDINEAYEFQSIMDDNGIDITDNQLDSIIRICQRGTYKAAFEMVSHQCL